MPFLTYGDMQDARRWIVTDGKKRPASGYSHPRIKRPDGKPKRVSQRERDGQIMVTAATPQTWLTYDEARAVADARSADGWGVAFVHTADDDVVFLDGDFKAHPGGNSREDFVEWMRGIITGLGERHSDLAVMQSRSGIGVHIIFRLPQDDMDAEYPKVILRCPCGQPNCEQGGKVENWVGARARYRIQAHPFSDDLLDAAIPIISRPEIAALPAFAEAYNRPQLSKDLPKEPGYLKSLTGGAYRVLEYLRREGLAIAVAGGKDAGFFFAHPLTGEWVEFGAQDSIASLTLYRRANDAALEALGARAVEQSVMDDFAAYISKDAPSRNLPEVRRQILSLLQDAGLAAVFAPRELSRTDFNRRADRYLSTADGIVDMYAGQRLDAAAVTAALITDDAPRLEAQDESAYTGEELTEARSLVDAFLLEGWGEDKLRLLLWHCQRRKGGIFIVGDRNRGKGLIFAMMSALGFAESFTWDDADAPKHKGRSPRFSPFKEARTEKRVTVFDELTGTRDFDATDVDADETPPDSAKMKALQGGFFEHVERKNEQAVSRRITAGLAYISNAPPCIPTRSAVYSQTDTNFVYAPAYVEALGQLGYGYAAEVMMSPPALNRLAQHILRLLPEVAQLHKPPLTPELRQDDAEISDMCQLVWQQWQASLKARK